MSYDVLVRISERWVVRPETASGPASLLATARGAFVLSWFHYELLVVAASWSLLAVEGALRGVARVDERPNLAQLIARAEAAGLIDRATAEQLHIGRELRNALIHSSAQSAWTLAMAEPVLAASHRLVAAMSMAGGTGGGP